MPTNTGGDVHHGPPPLLYQVTGEEPPPPFTVDDPAGLQQFLTILRHGFLVVSQTLAHRYFHISPAVPCTVFSRVPGDTAHQPPLLCICREDSAYLGFPPTWHALFTIIVVLCRRCAAVRQILSGRLVIIIPMQRAVPHPLDFFIGSGKKKAADLFLSMATRCCRISPALRRAAVSLRRPWSRRVASSCTPVWRFSAEGQTPNSKLHGMSPFSTTAVTVPGSVLFRGFCSSLSRFVIGVAGGPTRASFHHSGYVPAAGAINTRVCACMSIPATLLAVVCYSVYSAGVGGLLPNPRPGTLVTAALRRKKICAIRFYTTGSMFANFGL